jgi:hypothetical protein
MNHKKFENTIVRIGVRCALAELTYLIPALLTYPPVFSGKLPYNPQNQCKILEQVIKEEAPKFDVDPSRITCEYDDEYIFGENASVRQDKKNIKNYIMNFKKDGLYRGTVKHELAHIANGDFPTKPRFYIPLQEFLANSAVIVSNLEGLN